MMLKKYNLFLNLAEPILNIIIFFLKKYLRIKAFIIGANTYPKKQNGRMWIEQNYSYILNRSEVGLISNLEETRGKLLIFHSFHLTLVMWNLVSHFLRTNILKILSGSFANIKQTKITILFYQVRMIFSVSFDKVLKKEKYSTTNGRWQYQNFQVSNATKNLIIPPLICIIALKFIFVKMSVLTSTA